jgi:hypothetical protein
VPEVPGFTYNVNNKNQIIITIEFLNSTKQLKTNN